MERLTVNYSVNIDHQATKKKITLSFAIRSENIQFRAESSTEKFRNKTITISTNTTQSSGFASLIVRIIRF